MAAAAAAAVAYLVPVAASVATSAASEQVITAQALHHYSSLVLWCSACFARAPFGERSFTLYYHMDRTCCPSDLWVRYCTCLFTIVCIYFSLECLYSVGVVCYALLTL